MILDLEVEEVNAVLTILGETPTARGVYPLVMKIKNQGENQGEMRIHLGIDKPTE